MTVTLYSNRSAPEKLDKDITQIGSALALTPTAAIDILRPDILLGYNSAFLGCNYCYIDTYQRYYFVKITVDTAQRMILHCTVDPLMSFNAAIKSCPICVVRSETAGTGFVIDKQLPIDTSRYFVEGKFFPNTPLTYDGTIPGRRYILLVNGG